MAALLLVVFVGITISFVCSILESVLLSVTQQHIAVLKEQERRSGDLLGRMTVEINRPLSAILTLNTFTHTSAAAIGGALALKVFGSGWVALFSVVLTLMILVVSEIVPKTLGSIYWKELSSPAAYLLHGMMFVMGPLLVPLRAVSNLFLPRNRPAPSVSREEIEVLAELGRKDGTLEEEEFTVLANVMALGEISVADVMTPRTRIIAVEEETDSESLISLVLETGHSRLPVYRKSMDDVVGVVFARDAWKAARRGQSSKVAKLMRPAMFVPENKRVAELIREMRLMRMNLAIVIDEFGGTSGLVTLEDLIEEIVGEIHDEHEIVERPIQQVEGVWLLSGLAPIWEVNEQLGLELDEESSDTIGGFVFGELGRLAEVGDVIDTEVGTFAVLAMSNRRIEKLSFRPRPPEEEGTTEASGGDRE
jgi:putative hemolysin